MNLKKISVVPFLVLIKGYQYVLSPLLRAHCRFTPSCSQYALLAFGKYGVWKGFYLTLRRLSRCHPFSKKFGYDPVP